MDSGDFHARTYPMMESSANFKSEIRMVEYIVKDGIAQIASETISFIKKLTTTGETVNIALSGGTTPIELFKQLSRETIDWSNINLWWCDERMVSKDDPESNFGNAYEHLIKQISIPSENIHFTGYVAELYSKEIESRLDQFDLVILGMGDDGHTASIFPDRLDLFSSNKSAELVSNPYSGQKRITVTGKIINSAKLVIFMVAGTNKRNAYQTIKHKKEGYKKYPSAYVTPNRLLWIVDREVDLS